MNPWQILIPASCSSRVIKGREYGLDVMNDLDGRYRATIVKEKMAMRSGETDAAGTIDNKELEGLGRTLGTLLCHRGTWMWMCWRRTEPIMFWK